MCGGTRAPNGAHRRRPTSLLLTVDESHALALTRDLSGCSRAPTASRSGPSPTPSVHVAQKVSAALSHVRALPPCCSRGVDAAVPREVHQLDAVHEHHTPSWVLLPALWCMPTTAAAAASCCTRDHLLFYPSFHALKAELVHSQSQVADLDPCSCIIFTMHIF